MNSVGTTAVPVRLTSRLPWPGKFVMTGVEWLRLIVINMSLGKLESKIMSTIRFISV
jgi:hypothetical protein